MEPPSPWKRPNEVMQLHRLKKRKKALQERMRQPSCSSAEDRPHSETPVDLDFSRILDGEKRKNPFSKNKSEPIKKVKLSEESLQLDESSDKTLFALLNLPAKRVEKPAKELENDKLSTFSNLLQKYTAEHSVAPISADVPHKYLPIDWALKTKLRLMSPKPFAWNQTLKASEEASGITGFVRCLDTTTSSTLDTSPRARFHQTCLYWQHPHLPWISLFPRTGGKVAATSFLATNEEVKQALYREWTESFRSLFQLVRARHCPYFYVCTNTFTCLFRAAGVAGQDETVALIAPTTRGLRNSLRQEDVEFTMPLRPDSKKKLNTSADDEKPKNSSYDSCYDTMDDAKSPEGQAKVKGEESDDDDDEEDLDSDKFLSQLGTDVIKKINNAQSRLQNASESNVDSAAESLVMARGAEAQALFNFLLNCRSAAAAAGAAAGVPPTLLAPAAFTGGTLQALQVRESVISSNNSKYYSIELRGPLLPSTVHALFGALRGGGGGGGGGEAAAVSATFAHHMPTRAFSAAAAAIAKDDAKKENVPNQFAKAFNEENLSDCGLSADILRHFCSGDHTLTQCIDSVTYDPRDETFTW